MLNEQRLSYKMLYISFLCSDLVKGSVSNVTEASPVPELEIPQDPNRLHRLVSEGDVTGVRLVSGFLWLELAYNKFLFVITFVLFVFTVQRLSGQGCIRK